MLQVAHHHSVKAHATSYPPFTSLVCESDGDGSETSSFREAPDAVPWAIVRMQGSHRGGGDVRREGGGGGERGEGRCSGDLSHEGGNDCDICSEGWREREGEDTE